MRAFALLGATGPVIDDHPETIESDETPMACTLPPRSDPSLPSAVDEARALRAAYDRAVAKRGTTSVGRVITTDQVSEALGVLHRWANGARWTDTPPSNRNVIAVAHDIRTYYEEADLELLEGPPPEGERPMPPRNTSSSRCARASLLVRVGQAMPSTRTRLRNSDASRSDLHLSARPAAPPRRSPERRASAFRSFHRRSVAGPAPANMVRGRQRSSEWDATH